MMLEEGALLSGRSGYIRRDPGVHHRLKRDREGIGKIERLTRDQLATLNFGRRMRELKRRRRLEGTETSL